MAWQRTLTTAKDINIGVFLNCLLFDKCFYDCYFTLQWKNHQLSIFHSSMNGIRGFTVGNTVLHEVNG